MRRVGTCNFNVIFCLVHSLLCARTQHPYWTGHCSKRKKRFFSGFLPQMRWMKARTQSSKGLSLVQRSPYIYRIRVRKSSNIKNPVYKSKNLGWMFVCFCGSLYRRLNESPFGTKTFTAKESESWVISRILCTKFKNLGLRKPGWMFVCFRRCLFKKNEWVAILGLSFAQRSSYIYHIRFRKSSNIKNPIYFIIMQNFRLSENCWLNLSVCTYIRYLGAES